MLRQGIKNEKKSHFILFCTQLALILITFAQILLRVNIISALFIFYYSTIQWTKQKFQNTES